MTPRIARSGLLVALAWLAGCAATWVEKVTPGEPPATPSAVYVEAVRAGDELWQSHAIRMRRALTAELRRLNGFPEVFDTLPESPPAGLLIVSAALTELDKGNVAARWLIGFGAGRARTAADIALLDDSRQSVARFTVAKTYAGGSGLGGANFLDVDDLVDQLGVAAGTSITNWVKTRKLE